MGCGTSKAAKAADIKPAYSVGNEKQYEKRLITDQDPDQMRVELINWVEGRGLIQEHWFVKLMTDDEIKDFIGVFATFRCYEREIWVEGFDEEWDKFWTTGSGRKRQS